MREIKFRTFLNGRMSASWTLYEVLQPSYSYWTEDSDDSEVVIMQSTGLLDKNDKKIYERDILTSNTGEIQLVFYVNGCFVASSENGNELLCTACSAKEVIGNIYENPELLKSK